MLHEAVASEWHDPVYVMSTDLGTPPSVCPDFDFVTRVLHKEFPYVQWFR